MKKQIVRLIVWTAALASLAAATPAVLAQQPATMRGNWDARVTITNCNDGTPLLPTFLAIQQFHDDGSYISVDNAPPTDQKPGFGRWRHLNGVNYRLAFQFFTFNSDGSFSGSRKIRSSIVLAADGNSYTADITTEVVAPDGSVVGTGCATAEATRFRPFRD